MPADLRLAALPRASRVDQAGALLEERLRELVEAGCLPDDLRGTLDALALLMSQLERMPPGERRAALETWRGGARLRDALSCWQRRPHPATMAGSGLPHRRVAPAPLPVAEEPDQVPELGEFLAAVISTPLVVEHEEAEILDVALSAVSPTGDGK